MKTKTHALKTRIVNFRSKFNKKTAVLTTGAITAMSSVNANAGMDVTGVIADIAGIHDPVNQIAGATVGVVVIMYGWRKAKQAIS